jgi:hypothetical protein
MSNLQVSTKQRTTSLACGSFFVKFSLSLFLQNYFVILNDFIISSNSFSPSAEVPSYIHFVTV